MQPVAKSCNLLFFWLLINKLKHAWQTWMHLPLHLLTLLHLPPFSANHTNITSSFVLTLSPPYLSSTRPRPKPRSQINQHSKCQQWPFFCTAGYWPSSSTCVRIATVSSTKQIHSIPYHFNNQKPWLWPQKQDNNNNNYNDDEDNVFKHDASSSNMMQSSLMQCMSPWTLASSLSSTLFSNIYEDTMTQRL